MPAECKEGITGADDQGERVGREGTEQKNTLGESLTSYTRTSVFVLSEIVCSHICQFFSHICLKRSCRCHILKDF